MEEREIAIGAGAALVGLVVGYGVGKIGTAVFLRRLEKEQNKVIMWNGIFRKTMDMMIEGDPVEARNYFEEQATFMRTVIEEG